MDPSRDYLRRETHAAHRNLDTLMATLHLDETGAYRQFLRIHHDALSEIAADWTGNDLVDIDALLRLIASDLRVLGGWPGDPEPPCRPQPSGPIGVAYVLTGSHLGNAVLHKDWRRNADPAARCAGAYIASPLLGQAWPGVLARLASLTRPELETARESALWTFEVFQHHAMRLVTDRAQPVSPVT